MIPTCCRRSRVGPLGLGLLLALCFSFEARGDSHTDTTYESTDEADLAPGIKLRIESCGYRPEPPGQAGDDDDSAPDDDDTGASDDDDSGGGA